MATNAKKAPVQSAVEKKVAANVSKRVKARSNVASILDAKKKQGLGAPPSAPAPAKQSKSVQKRLAVQKPAEQGKVVNGVPCAVVEKPAKKVAAKKPVVVPSSPSVSPSETQPSNSSTQSAASSAAGHVKAERRVNHGSPIGNKDVMPALLETIRRTELDEAMKDNAAFLDAVIAKCSLVLPRIFGVSTYERLIRSAISGRAIQIRKPLFTGLAAAIERAKAARDARSAEYVKAEVPENKAAAEAATAEFNAKVASGELPEGLEATTSVIQPLEVCAKLVKAANQVPVGLLRFPEEDRERLTPFITFFERFWIAIPAFFSFDHSLDVKNFSTLQKQPEFANLMSVGSYGRFEFSCGSRAIVLRTLSGCATLFFAENEFLSMLKKMPGAVPSIIKEQAAKNKPEISLMTSIPNGLMAMVRDFEPQQSNLKLTTLIRIFGDPVNALMNVLQPNLSLEMDAMAIHLSVERGKSLMAE
jgi:hypothetical protein